MAIPFLRSLWVGLIFLASSPVVSVTHAAEKSSERRKEFDQLESEYDKKRSDFLKAIEKAGGKANIAEVQKLRPSQEEYAARFLTLSRKTPADDVARDALLWVLSHRHTPEQMEEAVALIRKHHLDSPLLAQVVPNLAMTESKPGSALVAILIEKGGSRDVRGLACLFLGYRKYAEHVQAGKNDEEFASIERLFERVKKDFADVPYGHRTLGKLADAQLYEMRNLLPGKLALELAGVDVAGKAMKLSDYRGKVVLLVFWSSSCGPCLAEVPHLRELTAKYAGRPFTILGVNVDDTREKAAKAMKGHKMTWPSFLDGEEGPLVERWNVTGLPDVSLIDAAGIIRIRHVMESEDLERAIDGLTRHAEAKRSP